MTVNYTTLLQLPQPVDGTEAGTWGDVLNNAQAAYLDIAIAGGLAVTVTTTDVTLAYTQGTSSATNIGSTTSQYAILNVSGAMTAARNLIVPSTSKWYIINNSCTGGFTLTVKGSATTGIGIVNGEKALIAWNGSDFVKVGSTIANAAGSNTQVQFNNSGVFGASANLTWNGTTLSTTGFTASSDSTFSSTGAVTLSKGTTAQQPGSPVTGMLRYNSTTNQFEGYSGASPAWASVGGAAISNDTATASFEYPLFAAATSGTALTVYTSNAKFLYKPSTGELQASEVTASNGLFLNATTVAASYTIGTGYNAMSVGPVTVASGQSVTVSSGQRWLVF